MTSTADESAASSVAPIEDDLADAIENTPPSPIGQSEQADDESHAPSRPATPGSH